MTVLKCVDVLNAFEVPNYLGIKYNKFLQGYHW